jgi:hypothetical protein
VGIYQHHLRYIERMIGLKPGAKTFGGMNTLMLPNRTLFIADTYVNYDPTAEQLVEITTMAAELEKEASALWEGANLPIHHMPRLKGFTLPLAPKSAVVGASTMPSQAALSSANSAAAAQAAAAHAAAAHAAAAAAGLTLPMIPPLGNWWPMPPPGSVLQPNSRSVLQQPGSMIPAGSVSISLADMDRATISAIAATIVASTSLPATISQGVEAQAQLAPSADQITPVTVSTQKTASSDPVAKSTTPLTAPASTSTGGGNALDATISKITDTIQQVVEKQQQPNPSPTN